MLRTLLSILLITPLFSFGQFSGGNESKVESAIIAGHIAPEKMSGNVTVEVFVQAFEPGTGVERVWKTRVPDNGQFRVERPMGYPMDLTIDWGQGPIPFFQEPGDSTFIAIGADGAITISGSHADFGKSGWEWAQMRKETANLAELTKGKQQKIQAGDAEAYAAFLEEWQNKELALEKAFATAKKPGKAFLKWLQTDRHWRYLDYQREFDLQPGRGLSTAATEAWIATHKLNPGLPESAAYTRHLNWVENSYQQSLFEELKAKGQVSDKEMLSSMLAHIRKSYQGAALEAALFKFYFLVANSQDPALVPEVVTDYTSFLSDYKDSPLMPGYSAFILNKQASDPTLQTVLDKHYGKVIVVDCWATWCGPCRVQLPFMHQLKDSLEGEDVDFVYFSFDRDQNAWKKMIQDMGLLGEHYFLGQGRLAREVNAKFKVAGIPRYIIFNKDGSVAMANAPRPGTIQDKKWVFNPVLLAKIRELLAEE